eukprot:3626406-Prymnesium_polylepis.3
MRQNGREAGSKRNSVARESRRRVGETVILIDWVTEERSRKRAVCIDYSALTLRVSLSAVGAQPIARHHAVPVGALQRTPRREYTARGGTRRCTENI